MQSDYQKEASGTKCQVRHLQSHTFVCGREDTFHCFFQQVSISVQSKHIYLLLLLLLLLALDALLALTLEQFVPWLNSTPTLIYLQIHPSSWPMLFCGFIVCCCASWIQFSSSSSSSACNYLFLWLFLLRLRHFHLQWKTRQSDTAWKMSLSNHCIN